MELACPELVEEIEAEAGKLNTYNCGTQWKLSDTFGQRIAR